MAILVLEVMVSALHVQKINIRPAISVQVHNIGVTAPASGIQSDIVSDLFKTVLPQILVQSRFLETLGVQMSERCMLQSDVSPAGPLSSVV